MVGLGNDGRVYIKTNDAQFSSDLSSDHWEKNGNTNITWSNQSAVPVEHLDELLKIYRGTGLPLERVIVDLHSGRFMGKFGILIIDISVVIFIALSMTGWWSWFKRRAIQKEIDAED